MIEDFAYPKISIVTPCYNAEDTIRDTINSIVDQGYPNLEYIIVDGQSSDRTMEIIHEFRNDIHLIISEKDHGMYDAVAKGFEHATGDILAYLNADDKYLPSSLARVAGCFLSSPQTSVIFFENIVAANGWLFRNKSQPRYVTFNMLANGHILYQDGVFFRREAYQQVGGINPKLRLAGDWDLWFRLSKEYALKKIDGHASCFMVRAGQLSSDMDGYMQEVKCQLKDYRKIYRKDIFKGKLFSPYYWALNLIDLLHHKWTWFMDVDYRLMGSPAKPISHQSFPLQLKKDIFTDAVPHTFLFSSPDTRFGIKELSYLFYHESSHMVSMNSQPIDFDLLYRNTYSKVFAEIQGTSLPPHYRAYCGWGILGKVFMWLLQNRLLFLPSSFRDKTTQEVISSVRSFFSANEEQVAFLDVACFEGNLLGNLRDKTKWHLYGIDINQDAVKVAQSKGFKVWQCDAEHVEGVLPEYLKFDVIHLGQAIEHFPEPLKVLNHLTALLKEGGVFVISSPNLDSAQIKLFGPTWSHWHPPFHQWIFSKRSMKLFAASMKMELKSFLTYSHPYWTLLSILLNKTGFSSAVPHDLPPQKVARKHVNQARSMAAIAALLWNWRGKGDYFYAVLQKVNK